MVEQRTSNLVADLREAQGQYGPFPYRANILLEKAATEIERLMLINAELCKDKNALNRQGAELERERDRLRALITRATLNGYSRLSPADKDAIAQIVNQQPVETTGEVMKVTNEMVTRFLGWKLPQDFMPDGGVTFTPINHPNAWPIGTNLLTAVQARAMLEHVLASESE